MSIFESRMIVRGALCAAVAVLITAGGWWGFEISTAHAPGHAAVASMANNKIPLAHSVFGRPEPAVLVD